MEKRLKERLFGAIILISLFVIFLPMILQEPEPLNHREIKPQPPIKDEGAWLEVPESLSQWQETIETQASEEADAAWTVQVATFADKGNAGKLKDLLNEKGYQAYLEAVPGNQDTLTWVLVGPHQEKQQAIAIQEQLKADFKVKALVRSVKEQS